MSSAPFSAFSANAYQTSNTWQEYCYTFTHDSTILSDVRLLKLQFLDAGTYFVDNATINSPDYICSSISSSNFENQLAVKVYPNPAFNTLFIENISELINIEIFDILGKGKLSIPCFGNKVSLNVEGLSSGTYFIVIRDEFGNNQSKRWLKR